MILAMMSDQLLPIWRAVLGLQENGLALINKKAIEQVDAFDKYSWFFGVDGAFSDFFIQHGSFPATINDPRGDPRKIVQVTVRSHREYIEIAREAVTEATKRFDLPTIYVSGRGEILYPTSGKGRAIR